MPATEFRVRGRVQGVGYRWFCLRAAQRLGISGFARNLADGSVQVVAEGDEDAIAAFARTLGQGPAFSRVDAVESTPTSPGPGEFCHGFEIR